MTVCTGGLLNLKIMITMSLTKKGKTNPADFLSRIRVNNVEEGPIE